MIAFDEPFLLALEAQRRSAHARAKQERYLALLQPQPGQRVLDLGCGGGDLCRALAPLVAPGGRVIGVDSAPEAVALARRLADGAAPDGPTFERADGHQLPFADGAFDRAVCISVLAFCEDPGRVLAELWRTLGAGGRLLVAQSDEDTRIYNSHDRELGRRIMRAIADRGRDPWLARRLGHLLTTAGFRSVEELVLTDVERSFTPDAGGHIVAHAWCKYLLEVAGIPEQDYMRWLADLEACAQEGTYCYSVTTYVYVVER